MLRAVLNKSWRQHSTKQQLYGHLPPITETIQIRRTSHAEEVRAMYSYGPLHTDEQVLDDQLEYIYSNSMPMQDVA